MSKLTKQEEDNLKTEGLAEEQTRQKQVNKKNYDYAVVKNALESGLKKGSYSTLEEIDVILSSFKGLK